MITPALPAAVLRQRETTEHTVEALRAALGRELGADADAILGEHTTFILTGSAGRGEMTAGSDVDGHVVRVDQPLDSGHDARLRAATGAALAALGLPPLDRGGAFLAMKSGASLTDCLGSADDDHTNALTTRMLFLLEGRPLLGLPAYETLLRRVQQAYRGGATKHTDDFLPFFLFNDIIRYWRTVLLNHEDRLRKKGAELAAEGLAGSALEDELLAHRRYRGMKLRFPRCLTCFSALTHVLAIAPKDSDSVSEADERAMFAMTPLERLRAIATLQPRVAGRIGTMLDLYGRYLDHSAGEKGDLVVRLREDPEFARTTSREGRRFTDEMFDLVQDLGAGNRLHRQMLI
ncbi:MAG: hypothetical protein CMN30_20910 [Sandaracinus sp.]|mgnify:CR=1 FL=1|nr:hypothetical protein [Sandaracinus sp.]